MFRPYVLSIIRLSLDLSSNCTNSGGSGVSGGSERDLIFVIEGGITLDIMANTPLFYHGALL